MTLTKKLSHPIPLWFSFSTLFAPLNFHFHKFSKKKNNLPSPFGECLSKACRNSCSFISVYEEEINSANSFPHWISIFSLAPVILTMPHDLIKLCTGFGFETKKEFVCQTYCRFHHTPYRSYYIINAHLSVLRLLFFSLIVQQKTLE
jgi:hypothetical protein